MLEPVYKTRILDRALQGKFPHKTVELCDVLLSPSDGKADLVAKDDPTKKLATLREDGSHRVFKSRAFYDVLKSHESNPSPLTNNLRYKTRWPNDSFGADFNNEIDLLRYQRAAELIGELASKGCLGYQQNINLVKEFVKQGKLNRQAGSKIISDLTKNSFKITPEIAIDENRNIVHPLDNVLEGLASSDTKQFWTIADNHYTLTRDGLVPVAYALRDSAYGTKLDEQRLRQLATKHNINFRTYSIAFLDYLDSLGVNFDKKQFRQDWKDYGFGVAIDNCEGLDNHLRNYFRDKNFEFDLSKKLVGDEDNLLDFASELACDYPELYDGMHNEGILIDVEEDDGENSGLLRKIGKGLLAGLVAASFISPWFGPIFAPIMAEPVNECSTKEKHTRATRTSEPILIYSNEISKSPIDSPIINENNIAWNDLSKDILYIRNAGLDNIFGTDDDVQKDTASDGVSYPLDINGQIFVYSNAGEIYLRNLGNDKLFGTADDKDPFKLGEGYTHISISDSNIIWEKHFFKWNETTSELEDILKIFFYNAGLDNIFGTDDDVKDDGSIKDATSAYPRIDGRNFLFKNSDKLYLYDLGPDQLVNTSDDKDHQLLGSIFGYPAIKGRNIIWLDSDINLYLYDLGEDKIYGTYDDKGKFLIDSLVKSESLGIGDRWFVWAKENNFIGYDMGEDGIFETYDDIGQNQLVSFELYEPSIFKGELVAHDGQNLYYIKDLSKIQTQVNGEQPAEPSEPSKHPHPAHMFSFYPYGYTKINDLEHLVNQPVKIHVFAAAISHGLPEIVYKIIKAVKEKNSADMQLILSSIEWEAKLSKQNGCVGDSYEDYSEGSNTLYVSNLLNPSKTPDMKFGGTYELEGCMRHISSEADQGWFFDATSIKLDPPLPNFVCMEDFADNLQDYKNWDNVSFMGFVKSIEQARFADQSGWVITTGTVKEYMSGKKELHTFPVFLPEGYIPTRKSLVLVRGEIYDSSLFIKDKNYYSSYEGPWVLADKLTENFGGEAMYAIPRLLGLGRSSDNPQVEYADNVVTLTAHSPVELSLYGEPADFEFVDNEEEIKVAALVNPADDTAIEMKAIDDGPVRLTYNSFELEKLLAGYQKKYYSFSSEFSVKKGEIYEIDVEHGEPWVAIDWEGDGVIDENFALSRLAYGVEKSRASKADDSFNYWPVMAAIAASTGISIITVSTLYVLNLRRKRQGSQFMLPDLQKESLLESQPQARLDLIEHKPRDIPPTQTQLEDYFFKNQ